MSGAVGLGLRDLTAGYGALPVLRKITTSVAPGQITVVLGHNGAGKSTLGKAIMGMIPVSGGVVSLDGVALQRLSIGRRLQAGVSLVLQERAVFPELTVLENLRLAGRSRRYARDELSAACSQAWRLFPILDEFRHRLAASLSGGQQRMLAIAMGLMTQPRFLILDEPSLGLSPKLVEEVMTQISVICRELGVTVLLIEQNVEAALKIATAAIAIRSGAIIYAGDSAALDSKAVVDLL
ncbi:MAG: ABC transporter ATP-binding protein [Rhodospirillales bacterium]